METCSAYSEGKKAINIIKTSLILLKIICRYMYVISNYFYFDRTKSSKLMMNLSVHHSTAFHTVLTITSKIIIIEKSLDADVVTIPLSYLFESI